MSKKKPMIKEEARKRRDHLLESAAAAELSLTEGVREMRAIAGMTQEEFARHREVSARVIKAIELGQGNPTVSTLNRIGKFFGLEVAFVPVMREAAEEESPETASSPEALTRAPRRSPGLGRAEALRNEKYQKLAGAANWEPLQKVVESRENLVASIHQLYENLQSLDDQLDRIVELQKNLENTPISHLLGSSAQVRPPGQPATDSAPTGKKRKARSG